MKYSGMSLTKYVEDLYKKNYKTMINKVKELNKLKDILYSWIGRQYCQDVSSFPVDL